MRIETVKKIVNKQFQMIGENVTYDDIKNGTVEIKGKLVPWYTIYHFKDEDQYNEWREWMKKEEPSEKLRDEVDLIYGMTYKYQKQKGQLDLF